MTQKCFVAPVRFKLIELNCILRMDRLDMSAGVLST